MGKVYRVGIIGTGRMGGLIEDELSANQFSSPYGHFSAYQHIQQTEVIAVANRGADRLQRFTDRFGISNTYLDYQQMIEKEKPDIVSITTPSFARAEPIIFAAEHGVKGIYAEKGLCASLEEADRISVACHQNGTAFNWGAMRRHHDGFIRLRGAIQNGEIGQPQYAIMYAQTDLIKHHPHTLDLVSMLLGDPQPVWVEGLLAESRGTRSAPNYDVKQHAFLPPEGEEVADPMVELFRVGYAHKGKQEMHMEGIFLPVAGRFDIDIHGTEGTAMAWDNGGMFRLRRGRGKTAEIEEKVIKPAGESPTVCTIRDIINEIETGQCTSGNIDVTMQSVEVQFGLAHSHLQGGERIALPVVDRKLYIPGG